MFSILPTDLTYSKRDKKNPNILIIDNVNDTNKKKIGTYKIHATSNITDIYNILSINGGSWSSDNTYKNLKWDDPLTSNNYAEGAFVGSNDDFSVCGGDYYKEGTCISVYNGDNTMNSLIKYINEDGIEVNLNAEVVGESIKFTFPIPYYIFESHIHFENNETKPQNYFILGKNLNSQWEIIGKNGNVNYNKNKDVMKINKSKPYTDVAFIFVASRNKERIKIKYIKLMGNVSLINEPNKIYTGFNPRKKMFNEYKKNLQEGFEVKKKVTFSNKNHVKLIEPIKMINNKYSFYNIEYIDYIPGILISLILGYTIINKK